jgi:hydrogenase nickel incorporation protein HypA/HybF
MHELSVCQALLDQVQALARANDALAVTAITVEVGPLSGLEPELLSRAYSLARVDTLAEEAELIVNAASIRVACDQCGAETAATRNNLVCGKCGNWRTRLVSGDELILVSVELETRPTLN